MRIRNEWTDKLGGLAVATISRLWMRTLDYRAAFYDRTVDPAHREFQGPAIFLFWHEYIPFLFYLRGNCNIAMLLSRHQDAEWLSRAARHMGFSTVRGSSSRGGTRALRELTERTRGQTNLAITPDGPRGPRRRLAPGAIYLSSKLGIPLVAIGLGYDAPHRMPTWDRFAVPRVGSRARVIVSPPVQIPSDLDRSGTEHYRQQVEDLLNHLSDAAAHWAESGRGMDGQVPVFREGACRRFRHDDLSTVAGTPVDMRASDSHLIRAA
ncbi:MAG: lysophospholipid acyltransferase family protein [Pirellulaceae bacterium]